MNDNYQSHFDAWRSYVSEEQLERRFADLTDTNFDTYHIISRLEHKIQLATENQGKKIEKELADIASVVDANARLVTIMAQSIISLSQQVESLSKQLLAVQETFALAREDKKPGWLWF